MQKTAQKRSLLNKLREMTNVSGIAAEKFFNPEFEDVMNRLRNDTDDPVRAIITGEKIGEAEPPSDGTSLKSLLSSAKSNLNRREYMKATADLGRFHKKMYDVVRILAGFKSTLDSVHEKFLFKDLDDESKEHLHDLKQRFAPPKTAASQEYFIKQANILDFFANIGTERGRALGAWEKRYPKQVAQLKKSSASILSQSERLLSIVLSVLKEMASARSVRNPDKYINAAAKILKSYDTYDKAFKDYYDNNVKPFEHIINQFAPQKMVDVSDKPSELGSMEVDPKPEDLNVPTLPRNNVPNISLPAGSQSVPFSLKGKNPTFVPTQNTQISPQTTNTEVSAPNEDRGIDPSPSVVNTEIPPSSGPLPSKLKSDQLAEEMWGKSSHRNFYQTLNKMSNESPIVLSSFIKKYADKIKTTDPATSIQLLKVVQSIKR